MNKQFSIALAADLLIAGVTAASAATKPATSGRMSPLTSEILGGTSGQQETFYNKRGHEQIAPTRFVQSWGDADLGG
jgi:hypothetical protein